MNFKRLLTTVLPILLVLSMLLTSCMDNGKSVETDTHTHESEDSTTKAPETPEEGDHDPEPEPTPGDVATCQHTDTTRKNQRDATCLLEGYTGDLVCLACGETVSSGTLTEKLDHAWNEGRVTKLATCIETGVKTITCTRCGTTETETLSTVEHKEEYHRNNETHTLTCSVCLESGEPERHTPEGDGEYHPATCLEGAYTIYTCSTCELQYKVYSTEELATGHEWDPEDDSKIVYEKDATCCEDGSLHMLCQYCGEESPSVTVPATGVHTFNYDDYIEYEAPTCTTAGKYVYQCESCDATEERKIASLGHNYVAEAPANDGWTHQMCSRCNDKISHYDASNDTQAQITTRTIDDTKPLEVKLETADIQFPKEVVDQMKTATDGAEVTITAGVVGNEKKEDLVTKAEEALNNNTDTDLNEEDVAALKDPSTQIYDFGVLVGNEPVVTNFDQKVTVTLPYTLKETEDGLEDPDGIVIWYVSDDGTVQKIENVIFRDEDGDGTGTVSFEAAHFSCYAVAYRETPEMRCRRDLHTYDYDNPEDSVEATCRTAGYAIYKCKYCDSRTVGNIKAPLGHHWSDEVYTDEADCTNSGRTYNICLNDDCDATRELTYIAPTGHKITAAATCETAAVCTVCNKVAVAAKGHLWNEWEDVVLPTEINSGLRRRYCQTCGDMEEVRLAATGNIKEWEFESYQELYETLFEEIFHFGNGTVSLEFELNGEKTTFNMTVNEEGDSYLVLVDIAAPNSYDGTVDKYQFVYRNGVMISKSDEYYGMDINALMSVPLEAVLTYTEQIFDYLNPYAEEGLSELRVLLDEYSQLYGTQIDTVLEAAGSTYRVAELAEVLDSFETVYAYLALKMGFATNLMVHDGVEVPTKSDWHNVFGALTKATESDGNKTYTLSLEPLMNSIDATLTWFETNSEKNMGEMLYLLITALYGDSFTETYENLTDWDSTFNYFTDKYNGDVVVKDLIDDLISMVESSGVCTMQDLYALADELMQMYVTGEAFDSEAYVQEYSDLTLDQLVQKIMKSEKATVADLYSLLYGKLTSIHLGNIVLASFGNGPESEENSNGGINEAVNGGWSSDIQYETNQALIGEIEDATDEGADDEIKDDTDEGADDEIKDDTDEGAQDGESDSDSNVLTIDDVVATIRDRLASIKPEVTFEVTLDENGSLIALKLDQFVSGDQEMPVESLLFEIKQDDNAKVVLPEDIKNATENKLSCSYDANGNLVISGLNENIDLDFSVSGYGSVDLTQHLTKDEAMSEKKGYDVYVLDREYWNETELISGNEYVVKDGKFYEAIRSFRSSYYVATKLTKLDDDILEHPEQYLPDTSKTTHEYYRYRGNDGKYTIVPVYQTILGLPAYQLDGEWYMLLSTVGSSTHDEVDPETGMTYVRRVYQGGSSAPFIEAVASMSLSSLSNEHASIFDQTTDKVLEDLHIAYFYMDGSSSTVRLNVQLKGDDIYLIQTEYVASRTVLTVGSEATNMPAYDFCNKPYWNDVIVQLADGTVTTEYVPVSLYVKVPTYYAKYDGHYFDLSGSSFCSASAKILKTVTLDDGREFYVVNETAFNGYEKVLVGYFKTPMGYYVQAACLYSMDQLQDIVYRYGEEQYEAVNLYHMFNLDSYVSKNSDGTYTVKAELFTKLKELCAQPGDLYSLAISGRHKIGNLNYEVNYWLNSELASMDFVSYLMSQREEGSFDWDDWFGYGDSDGIANQFDITVNKDGTISIFVDEDQVAFYQVSFWKQEFDADQAMTYDKTMSEKIGVPVYSVTNYSYSTNFYFEIDGEYYSMNLSQDYLCTVREMSLVDLFADWKVSNLSLNYYTLEGNEPVYRGTVEWENRSPNYQFSLNNRFFQIKDGTLYILTEVEEMGDSTIKYESCVKASEYFKSLRYVLSDNFDTTSCYLKDGKTQIYRVLVTIMEGDHKIGDAYVPFYFKNEEKTERQYLVIEDMDSRYKEYGRTKVTLPDTWQEVGRNLFKIDGVLYDRVLGAYLSSYTNYYVKIDSHYYALDSVDSKWMTEEGFMKNYGESSIYYVVENEDGSVTVYEQYGVTADEKNSNLYVMKNEIDSYESVEEFLDFINVNKDNAKITSTPFGSTVDGGSMYEYSIQTVDNLNVKELEDRTVFYYNAVTGDGCVKLADDKYVPARLVSMGDGSEKVVCTYVFAYTPSGPDLLYSQGLLDCIQAEGNELILSSELLDLLHDYGENVSIRVMGYYLDEDLDEDDWYSSSEEYGYIYLKNLSAWFELAEQKNA